MVLLKGYRRSTSCLLTLLASHLLTAYAQSFRPLTVFGASSVFIENKAMYITGGTREGTVANQTFSLDLSSPWTAAAPNFTELENNRAPMDYQIPSALDKDQTRWFIVSGKESYFYDIPRKEWNRRDALANLYNVTATFLQATVDPVSNSLLIPNGFETTTSTSIDSSMMQYDIVRGTTRSISMEGGPINRYAASVVWSTYLNKLVTFGGGLANETFGLVHTYGSSSGWNEMRTANAGPSPRAYHCAVVANDGKKMVVFGGRTLHSITFLGDIYVLDLETWAWSAGTPLNSGLNRSSIACGASGDYFVSWGGLDQNRRVVASNYTLLFNIKTMSWTDSFVPPPSLPEEKKSKVGMIVGIAAGVVVFLAIVGFIFYRRSKRPQDGKNKNGNDGGDAGGVTVVPISAIDANHIWQPPTLMAQSDPSTPVVDPYALQQHHHQPVYDHHQQPVYDQQQQLQYLDYNQQQSPNNRPSPIVHTDGSPVTTGYTSTAYSPDQQQYQYTDGTQAYKADDRFIPPPPVVRGGNDGTEYKIEHTPENPNRTSVSYGRGPQAPQLHGDSPHDLENKTSSGVTIRNKYAE